MMKSYKLLLFLGMFFSVLMIGGCASTNVAVQDNQELLNYYGKQEISSRTSILDEVSTWGKSRIREEWNITSTADITEENGEIVLSTGTSGDGKTYLRTKERGQYISGTIGKTGIGVRILENATGNQYARWGYYDGLNGFGWEHNASCELGTFVLRNGVEEGNCLTTDDDVHMPNNFSIMDGYTYTTEFVWYGQGPIEWFISNYDNPPSGEQFLYRQHFKKKITLIDPNQPLRVEVDNNGTADNFSLYLGGRQMSYMNGRSELDQTAVVQQFDDYTLPGTEDVWYPIFAMRLKDTFGPSDRPNSVRVAFKGASISCTENCRFRATFDSTTLNNSNWRNVSYWGEDSATEVKLANETSINVVDTGLPFLGGEVPVAKSAATGTIEEEEELVLGTEDEIIIWVLQDGNSVPEVDLTVKWNEQR